MMEKDDFAKRVSEEYGKWLVFITGKTESVDVPFFPVASFDRKAFSEFVAELVSRTISKDFNMLSVITQRGKPMFVLVEHVQDGRFVSVEVLKPEENLQDIKRKHNISIVKSVERQVLEKLFDLQDRYKSTRDKRTYVLEVAAVMLNALKKKQIVFSPAPKVLRSLTRAIGDIKVETRLLMGLRDYLASVVMVSGKSALFLDMGTPLRIVIQKERLFQLIGQIEGAKHLPDLLDAFLIWLADGFKDYSIKVEPGSFIWAGLERIVEHDAVRVGRKTKFMLSMLADPLRILVMVGEDSYVLEFRKGVVSEIERVESKAGDLKATWLDLSRRRGFVHLAFRVDPKAMEQAISKINFQLVFKRNVFEFYPKNEFIEHLNEMGVLNLILKLVYPFVKH